MARAGVERARRLALLLAVTAPALAPSAASASGGVPAGARPPWNASVEVDGNFQSRTRAYLVPQLLLDRGGLHLEARYNYEEFDTASAFAGWNFAFGGEGASLTLTPMAGAVVGRVNGVAPGVEVDAGWGRLSFSLESEYLFDLGDGSETDLYASSELHVSVVPWLWVGVALQRTKLLRTASVFGTGPMIGFGNPGTPGWSVSAYAYELGEPAPIFQATIAVRR